MKLKHLHAWDVSAKEAVRLQKQWAGKTVCRGNPAHLKIVAGADISYSRNSSTAYAGAVLLSFPSLEVIGRFTCKDEFKFPYVPGLLSFREAPCLLKLFKNLHPDPDLIFFDGHGYAHPRKFGLACHLGLILDCPTIGCAKSRLVGSYREPGNRKGSVANLTDDEKNTIGAVVRSREGCKPIFISAGHRIGLDAAVRRTLECVTRYRIPEPTRLAHQLVNEFRKADSS